MLRPTASDTEYVLNKIVFFSGFYYYVRWRRHHKFRIWHRANIDNMWNDLQDMEKVFDKMKQCKNTRKMFRIFEKFLCEDVFLVRFLCKMCVH